MLLLNAFSFNMLPANAGTVVFNEISATEAAFILANEGLESAVGHTDTAAVFADALGLNVPVSRVTVSLDDADSAIVGQYSGPRLPEGATALPEGASIRWLFLHVSTCVFFCPIE
jgi:hypothetical protein